MTSPIDADVPQCAHILCNIRLRLAGCHWQQPASEDECPRDHRTAAVGPGAQTRPWTPPTAAKGARSLRPGGP